MPAVSGEPPARARALDSEHGAAMTLIAQWKPDSPSARCHTVEDTARMDNGRLVVWNPLYRTESAGVNQGRPA